MLYSYEDSATYPLEKNICINLAHLDYLKIMTRSQKTGTNDPASWENNNATGSTEKRLRMMKQQNERLESTVNVI